MNNAPSAARTNTNHHAAQAEDQMDQPLSTNSLPYFQGMYDPLANPRLSFYGNVRMDSGNKGVAFSTTVNGEERVVAVVFTNDVTMHAPAKTSLDAILKGAPTTEKPAEDRQRVWVRGPILSSLGNPGDFNGTGDFARMGEEERTAALTHLRESDPRIANLVENRKAYIDVRQGDKRGFFQALSVPVKELVSTIRDLNESNCKASKTPGREIQPHLGSHRIAEVLEAGMRLLERNGTIPNQGVSDVIAVDRFRQQQGAAAKTAAASSNDEPPL